MPTVTFLPSYRKVSVERGATILDAAQQAGLNMNVVCGGKGKCGKCIVYVKDGYFALDREKYAIFFTPEEVERGACLACQAEVSTDMLVLVPDTSLIQEQKILVESLCLRTGFCPSVRKYCLELTPPTLEDPSPDLTRLLWGIERQGGPKATKIFAPLDMLRSMSQLLRSSDWKVTATVAIVPGGYRLINLESGRTTERLYGAAVDLGTTTIAATIRSLIDGSVAGTGSTYNRQIGCGEDILSRVNYAQKSGLSRLQQLAAESINIAIRSAADSAGIDMEDIYEVEIAGNTVMTHLLLSIDPSYMIAEPYVPVVRRSIYAAAGRLGIAVHPAAGVYTFPAVSNFIGGDIIADILTCGMGESEDVSLLIDIGTNFEVVLGNSDWMLSAAGAAGPALEGGEVLFGMRANPGAIERIEVDRETLDVTYATINGAKPRGLCGSALIDLPAELLRACVIDRTGLIDTRIDHPRVRKGPYYPEFVVAFKEETDAGKDIVVTENDIKNLIMSKAAVLAACLTLIEGAGITLADIQHLYLSGAFGNYINKQNAVTIGLIPEIPLDRIQNIGNGALEGANIALINRDRRLVLDEIAFKIAYIELNADPSFMDRYTSSCFLPHTDLALFPGVQAMLEACRLRREVVRPHG
ncbi:MAG: ASKHA domain-containing protein [Methanomicrobiales archaeon]|nr:ASKHA domain-containing protein [Methanomicrobiales archaeon]MDI6876570.1 ASKHA domain-containing protein [Methanomicrobiales archaeon]